MWIRKEGAFEGIVPVETFITARNILDSTGPYLKQRTVPFITLVFLPASSIM